ncbi:MAG: hypothetical protein UY31_C0021G0007 [Candidatus Wolfebacteria bacterium GW2011_GWE1_48_7]|uniref:Uncharacterized protein n=2 Tax=Candidatus Wolfeibacteriota TaxID=1752735 RepID=A0A0G1U7P2_9BACT|nr:MAG: hypothetical protein UX70_C0001G0699 [Candidatus Wolfebacteria bacterium GW2011_GWB1_47_1]KKU37081.1 MAG: hypothetical protein UX49_C0002G0006 [Candidatus Wolfebacteria bacterium GW2011_GWC2_46_275]KKU42379.1 MAG: hypothetical protein UX58_C0002G0093 [Candidatus Wolfebacteria bacterium GW2011_GWB2_46_69]KKU54345.1 MAG: hypothetical protein UX76_C0003G0041 [Candidatus Wolfebacteria bacterium GW2011_GWC1_47_103]KKU59530.1 MAG: hypothetical protein UX83_C0004G0032 [Candidatus Wolfebacteria
MDKIDQGDLYERADAIGEKVGNKARKKAYNSALIRLQRSAPIIDILQRYDIPPFIGPTQQRGFSVLIQEEEPGFIAHVEKVAGKSLDAGTLLYPNGFGEYAGRLEAAKQYQRVLAHHEIEGEIINIPNPGTEEDLVVLYIPPLS